MTKKRKGRKRETEFIGLPPEEVERRARDRSLSAAERLRYLAHAKALRVRNRQKRQK